MCGIAGIVGSDRNTSERIVSSLLTQLVHRGPDSTGVAIVPGGAIGMTRLRVRGAPDLKLPILTSGQISAYNGEVYGFLTTNGHRLPPPSGGPNEVATILAGGPDGAPDGMYALASASLDPSRPAIDLYRDPFGIKPLFVRTVRGASVFASEIPALLSVLGTADIDSESLADFLAFGRPLGSRTLFRGVSRVPPGAHLRLCPTGITVLGTVSRPTAAGSVDPDTLAVALKHAIEICLVGDRRIGLALSGGLDSTLIAGVVDSLGIEDINTVSLTIEGSPDGLATLHALGLPKHGAWRTWRHARVHIEPRMLPKAIARAVAIMGEPIRMTSVPLYCALAGLAAQQGITVLLLGEGSDELFLGYESYRTFFATPRSRAASLPDVLDEFACPAVQREWTKRLVGRAALDGALERLRSVTEAASAEAPEDALRRLEYTLSLEPLLLRADHALMSHGIEGRTPFLHGAVPALGSAARQRDLLDEATGKVLLHRTASRILPGGHPRPPKRPFRAPIAAWFNGELGRWTSRRIRQSSPSLEVVGIRPRGVEELALAVEAGDGRVAPVAFAVLCLAAWVESLADVGGGTAAAAGPKRPSRPPDE